MDTGKYTFKKSTCERYDIRFGQCGWATITIDENGGMFNCQSDYGTYAYSWPHHGRKTFKHFLIGLAKDHSYLLGKVSKQNWHDYDKTIKQWKKAIIDCRKRRDCSKEDAREVWDFILGLDDYSFNPTALELKIYDSDEIYKICDGADIGYMFPVEMDYSPQAYAFAKEIMPMLAEILMAEITLEELKEAQ